MRSTEKSAEKQKSQDILFACWMDSCWFQGENHVVFCVANRRTNVESSFSSGYKSPVATTASQIDVKVEIALLSCERENWDKIVQGVQTMWF